MMKKAENLKRRSYPNGNMVEKDPSISRTERVALFLLSAATLIFEINLTRLFSVAQFYHFAFMIVSLALLGFGASGSFLAFFPNLGRRNTPKMLAWLSLASSVSMLAAYLLFNGLPFDSFSITWDRRQVAILALHYLGLATPFFFSGLATSMLLAAYPLDAGPTYSANLTGSALGCAAALVAPTFLGGEGVVILSSGVAALGGLAGRSGRAVSLLSGTLVSMAVLILGLHRTSGTMPSWLALRISPYKSLSYALQYPGAELISQQWNAFSRVDVVRSPGIRSLPGLSYRYTHVPPAEDGLLVDGGELCPVLRPGYNPAFIRYLPAALAFELRPQARALILDPCGGLDILTALEMGATQVVAVESNPLVVAAAETAYLAPGVEVVHDSGRSFTRRTGETFDVVVLSLVSSYHPVRSGAYSLAEDYRYTVEGFQDAHARLKPGGILIVTRWLQNPPSEELRAFALAVTALERSGTGPRQQLVAYRGYNMATLLVKNGPFSTAEMSAIRQFTQQRAFDLIYAPGIQPEETNRYNRLPESVYYLRFNELLNAASRQAFYQAYPFEVSPPTDDRPFFGHFFKWSQAGQVWAEMGKTWQPFGGAGYFVILAMLLLAGVMAGVLILLPVAARHARLRPGMASNAEIQALGIPAARQYSTAPVLAYFGLIGLAYLLVEIPLLQRFILYLGHPAYSIAAILFTLLFFSGLGSRWGQRIALGQALACLAALLVAAPALFPVLFNHTLGWPLAGRLALTAVCLAPAGFLMGMPLPGGVRLLSGEGHTILIPWAWATNGAASVIASVLAALLALSFGFSRVLWLGAACYAGAWAITALYLKNRSRLGGTGNTIDHQARSASH